MTIITVLASIVKSLNLRRRALMNIGQLEECMKSLENIEMRKIMMGKTDWGNPSLKALKTVKDINISIIQTPNIRFKEN